jgi:hypothetical protein
MTCHPRLTDPGPSAPPDAAEQWPRAAEVRRLDPCVEGAYRPRLRPHPAVRPRHRYTRAERSSAPLPRRTVTLAAGNTAAGGLAKRAAPGLPVPDAGGRAVPAGQPSSWAGFGALLAGVSDRVPADVLTLSAARWSSGHWTRKVA